MIRQGVIAAVLSLAMCGCAGAQQTPASAPAADAQTQKVVAAAKAFVAKLDAAQKAAVQFAFDDEEQRKRWSNLPTGIYARKGVRWGDLDEGQRAALVDLLGTVLSPYGVKMVREMMDADDTLKRPGGPRFGSEEYYVSFLGEPSVTAPWMLQFGGHHLAINATIAGGNVSLAPSLTGGQPVKFTKDGKPIYIVDEEVRQANAMLAGLTPAQKAKAVVSTRRIDLVLGPGHDGKTLQPEGLPASEMTEAQKKQLLALIESRLGIMNADDLSATMADVRANLDRTYFAWFGPTENAGAAYFRATGPTLILEFSPQDLGGDASNHLHNMYRNPANDYGAAWVK